jgi:protoporphyrinogen oxidase
MFQYEFSISKDLMQVCFAGRLADDIEALSDEAAVEFTVLQLKRILPTACEPVCTSDS